MKKTMVSLIAASLVATSAMAIDVKTSGQAVVYTQTLSDLASGSPSLGSAEASRANFGVQVNIDADLGNGYALGTQLTHLSTAGLSGNFVDNTMQGTADVMVTKVNLAKKIGNTTIKVGRQELPKSLSPLAFSEGWNVFKNTFDAALVINSDLPSTTVILAAVDTSNGIGTSGLYSDFTTRGSLQTSGTATTTTGALMATVQTTLVPMATITGSFYKLGDLTHATLGNVDAASAYWVDTKVANKSLPMGLKVAFQYGSIIPDNSTLNATTALGAKVGLSVAGANICLLYSSVDDGTVGMTNTGTGAKTPLYTQMILNQSAIDHDSDTIAAKVNYSLGENGKILAGFSTSSATVSANDNTYIEAAYIVDLSGANILLAYINTATGNADATHAIRVVARVAF